MESVKVHQRYCARRWGNREKKTHGRGKDMALFKGSLTVLEIVEGRRDETRRAILMSFVVVVIVV